MVGVGFGFGALGWFRALTLEEGLRMPGKTSEGIS